MKRWQDRGEVEDSEGDEDLSLDADTPSPERAHKRAKHTKEGKSEGDVLDHGYVSDDEDESNWLQAKKSTTYGRRGKVAKRTSAPASCRQTPIKKNDISSPGSNLTLENRTISERHDHQKTPNEPTPNNSLVNVETDNGLLARSAEATGADALGPVHEPVFSQGSQRAVFRTGGSGDLSCSALTAKQIVQPKFCTSVLLKGPVPLDGPVTGATEGEPVVDDSSEAPDTLEAQSGNAPKHTVSGKDDFMSLSDVLSSPLSERAVSPPLNLSYHTTEMLATLRDGVDTLSDAESLPQHSTDPQAHSLAFDANGRRSLRARQEKQLHPYMYDKAQYQKQFRERGLKPVRVVEQATPDGETQSVSQSAASQDSVGSSEYSSSISHSLRVATPAHLQLDYFDAADGSSNDELGRLQRPLKRRKVGGDNRTRPGQLPIVYSAARLRERPSGPSQQSIPPSPPRTSSDIETPTMGARSSRDAMSGFRLPPGRVIASLPTPQISSDARPLNFELEPSADSPIEMPKADCRESDPLSSELSSSASEVDPLAEAETKRLRREQKRIKGVLPASWLRIDFRKQRVRSSPSPTDRPRLSAESSPRTEPQRGVARKVFAARSRQSVSPGLRDIVGGGSEDSDDSARKISALPKQSRLTLEDERLSVHPIRLTMDDVEMENDIVDPMLAGRSRSFRGKKRGPNQPRITDTFRESLALGGNLKQDRVARMRDDGDLGRFSSGQRHRRRRDHPRPAPAHLSIVDAPRSPSTTGSHMPQFIRLALRHARDEPNRGRHSPTTKLVRLATVDETEEASSVLRAWREGTIAPRRSQSPDRPHSPSSKRPGDMVGDNRIPLASLPTNVHQPRIQATGHRKGASSTARPPQEVRKRLKQMRIGCPAAGARAMDQEPLNRTRSPGLPRRRQTFQRSRLRDAQLETLETEFDQLHRAAAFERRMQLLTESVARPEHRSRASVFQLARVLLADNDSMSNDDSYETAAQALATESPILPHRPRKKLARRLETGTCRYRQPSEPLPQSTINEDLLNFDTSISAPVLEGLGSFGTRYSADFDIEPLGLNTFFQHTTFIGSGEFKDALNLAKRDLTSAAGRIRVQLGGEMLEWGAWNEDVAASFSRIPLAISEDLQTLETNDVTCDREQQLSAIDSNIDYLLRSVSRFCSKCLYFEDAVDRQSCADSLHRLVDDLEDVFSGHPAAAHPLQKTITKVIQYGLVIAMQASQISDHHVVPALTKSQIEDLILRTSKRLASMAVLGHFEKLRSFYEDNKHADRRQAGIDGNAHAVSSVVILNNALSAKSSKSLLWPVICSTMGMNIGQLCAVGLFDKLWYDLFSLLPALEIAATGTVNLGSRLAQPRENWSLPQAMLSRAFELYESSSAVRGYSVNDYIRALLSRCYSLVNKWGWWRCETVLNVIYDFFSRRGLALLKKEDSRGSPRFLDQLGGDLVELEVHSDDRSFHMFLKILASGLIGMRKYQLYGDRKIQGIAWRFIPNHNRTYRKDADVERSTLDALRNHHDLICTLYYASPPGHRPGVHLLRELVDHSTSHREACRLNVKSWAKIASFQASTTESLEVLRLLTSWFADIMKTTIAQYRLAKSEAQQAFDQAKIEGANPSEMLLEHTVTKNQRQLAATLVDALAGLKRALASAGSLVIASFLVEETAFWTIFELFDPSQRRLVGAMIEALQVVEIALDIKQRSSLLQEIQHSSDDSQDFGDSDALQEFASNDKPLPDNVSIVEVLLGPVGRFMSNALGADVAPDDHLLQKAIDVWVRLAAVTVEHTKRTWLDYVNDYSATGWGQMRDTAQKRKFTTYFMSCVIDQSTLHSDVAHHVMTAWLLSLVEREALLKFQHVLTSAILTHFGQDRLLQNLPFAKDNKGEFHVTLSELRQRRLALISSIFCNMREIHERAGLGKLAEEVRMLYEGMLRQLMQAMKSNYQELQTTHTGVVADASIQGAYVNFVQQVVSSLQQHTTAICKVDGFFTDSTAFPLPSDDPTYVVGRLKGYVPLLRTPKARKELATFVQSVGERAAVDGQQPYLVNQLSTAMKGVVEQGDRNSPSLRYLLLTTIFPAYIDSVFTTACSWISVLPVLQACEHIIPDSIYNVMIEDDASVSAARESVAAVLHSINQQVGKILDGFPGMLGFSHVLRTISAMLLVGTSTLSIASLMKRSTLHGDELVKQIRALRELLIELKGRLEGITETSTFEASVVADPPVSPWPETRSYVETQLRDDMKLWHAEDGRYYLKRYGRMQEAVMSLRESEEERKGLLLVVDDLLEHTMLYLE